MVNEENTENVEEKNEEVAKNETNEKMVVIIGFKSGNTIKIKCDEYSFTTTGDELTGYKFKGVEGDKPVYIDFSQIEYILQN